MLVLSRKQGQEILLGDQIKVTVLKNRGNTVRLGIEAPREVKVVRGELTSESGQNDDRKEDSAEFTIVFGSDAEADSENSDGPQSVQFRTDHRQSNLGQEAPTVRYEGRLPRVLKHNRLKQIVDRIAVENAGVRVSE